MKTKNKKLTTGVPAKTASPLFVYLKTSTIEPEALMRIGEAGYIPLAVESFDEFKIVETLPVGAVNAITKAAFQEIVSGYASSAESFGRQVAKTMSD